MKYHRRNFQKLDWDGVTYSPPVLALARVTAVSLSYINGSVTFLDVAEALAADGLQCPPAAEVFKPGMFMPVGPADGRPAWKAV